MSDERPADPARQHDPQVQVARINRTGTILTAVIGAVATLTAAIITGVVTYRAGAHSTAAAPPSTVTVYAPAAAGGSGPASVAGSTTTTGAAGVDRLLPGGRYVGNLAASGDTSLISYRPLRVAGTRYAYVLHNDSQLCTTPWVIFYQTDGRYGHFSAKVGVATGDANAAAVVQVLGDSGTPVGDPVTVETGQPFQTMTVDIGSADSIGLTFVDSGSDCDDETVALIDPQVY